MEEPLSNTNSTVDGSESSGHRPETRMEEPHTNTNSSVEESESSGLRPESRIEEPLSNTNSTVEGSESSSGRPETKMEEPLSNINNTVDGRERGALRCYVKKKRPEPPPPPPAQKRKRPQPERRSERVISLNTSMPVEMRKKNKKNKSGRRTADSSESEDDERVRGPLPLISRARVSMLATPRDERAPAPGDENSFPPAGLHLHFAPEFYDFRWNGFPEPAVEPELRREKFTAQKIGPTQPSTDPYEIFTSMWTRKLMQRIAAETNRYAKRNDVYPDWRNTRADELYIYVGLVLATGIVVMEQDREHWRRFPSVLRTPGFRSHMTYRRFWQLTRCLRFAYVEQSDTGPEADVARLQPLLTHMDRKFSELYTPDRNVAMDNTLTQWKDYLDVHKFHPRKTGELGLRSYEVCDAFTGYLWRFEVRAAGGRAAAAPGAVLRLTAPLQHQGYTLWMDSLYHSPCLARRLKQTGIDTAGTLRTNRQFIPKPLDNLNNKCLARGQVCGLTSGDVDVMVSHGVGNRVAAISTYHGNELDAKVGRPRVLTEYRAWLRRLDHKDRCLAKYPMEARPVGAVQRMFRRLLNVSVLNAHVIYLHSAILNHRQFRIRLVDDILMKHRATGGRQPKPKPPTVDGGFRIGL